MKLMICVAAACAAAGVAHGSWSSSLYTGGDSGFRALTNDGLLERAVAEGRIGDRNSSGAWERAIWRRGGAGSPVTTGNLVFESNQPVSWDVQWDGISTVSFMLGGQTLSWNAVPGSFSDIFIRTRAGANSTIDLTEISLDGNPIVPNSLSSSGDGDVDYLRLTHASGNAPAFRLSGRANLAWTATPPNGSGLAFQVKLTNVPTPGAAAALLGLSAMALRRRR